MFAGDNIFCNPLSGGIEDCNQRVNKQIVLFVGDGDGGCGDGDPCTS